MGCLSRAREGDVVVVFFCMLCGLMGKEEEQRWSLCLKVLFRSEGDGHNDGTLWSGAAMERLVQNGALKCRIDLQQCNLQQRKTCSGDMKNK